jgi:hypothetical protein
MLYTSENGFHHTVPGLHFSCNGVNQELKNLETAQHL